MGVSAADPHGTVRTIVASAASDMLDHGFAEEGSLGAAEYPGLAHQRERSH
jgi:hypothetical protein